MISEALGFHPELAGRMVHHELPGVLPFEEASFDIVTSMAVIMHLEEADLSPLFGEIFRVTRLGGLVAYSVNTARSGLDADGNDPEGRHFTCLSREKWEGIHTDAGLTTIASWESEDVRGRSGIRWATFICRKGQSS